MASAPPPRGWVLPALRNVGLMLLVMANVLVGLGAALSALGDARPAYPEAVLEPARAQLVEHQALLGEAQRAAVAGDHAGARRLLAEARDAQAAFARAALQADPPQAPALRDLHARLQGLYAVLADGLGLAVRCMDDLAAGAAPQASTACREGWLLLQRALELAQELADRVAALSLEFQ